MQSDYRREFYSKYDSTYKVYISDFSQRSIAKIWRKNDYLYLPLISSYSSDVPILEIGCGRGIMLEYLRNNGFNNLKGIDISEEQINISKHKGFDVEVADVFEYLNRSKDKFKIIFALDFIEHFSKEELIPLFKGIYDRLDNGGSIIFHTPNGQTILSQDLIYGDLTHLTIFTPNSALQLLRAAGFNDITFHESGPVPKNLNGFIRSVLWRIIKFCYNIVRIIESGTSEKILTRNFIATAKKIC